MPDTTQPPCSRATPHRRGHPAADCAFTLAPAAWALAATLWHQRPLSPPVMPEHLAEVLRAMPRMGFVGAT